MAREKETEFTKTLSVVYTDQIHKNPARSLPNCRMEAKKAVHSTNESEQHHRRKHVLGFETDILNIINSDL